MATKKQPDGFKYKFTTSQVTYKNGETYKVCSICGDECKSNMGIEMTWNTTRSGGGLRLGFCHQCSKKYSKVIEDFVRNISERNF